MKGVFVVIGLLIAIGAGVYYFGIAGYDPDAQGAAAKAAVTPGMTFDQVIAATKEPKNYYDRVVDKREGVEVEPSGPNKFQLESFRQRFADGGLPDGFIFEYRYSGATAFGVSFDGAGKVEDVHDLPTAADLFR